MQRIFNKSLSSQEPRMLTKVRRSPCLDRKQDILPFPPGSWQQREGVVTINY